MPRLLAMTTRYVACWRGFFGLRISGRIYSMDWRGGYWDEPKPQYDHRIGPLKMTIGRPCSRP